MKKSETAILLALVFSLFFVYGTEADRQAEQIRNSTLRLHIIPRDDTPQSQIIKAQVKSTTEKLWPAMYCRADSFEKAVVITRDNLDYIQQVTDSTLKNMGAGYRSRCSLENFYFDTSQTDGITLPRGQYTALTIRLGEAEGKNWWCVLYPQLRAGAGSDYEEDTANALFETENFRIKLKAVEWLQDIKHIFSGLQKYDNL